MSTTVRTTISFIITATASTDIYTLSLHDALPIWALGRKWRYVPEGGTMVAVMSRMPIRHDGRNHGASFREDRKSTRLNSSHPSISYAVFCLKKKSTATTRTTHAANIVAERCTPP